LETKREKKKTKQTKPNQSNPILPDHTKTKTKNHLHTQISIKNMEFKENQTFFASFRTWCRKSLISLQGWHNFQEKIITCQLEEPESDHPTPNPKLLSFHPLSVSIDLYIVEEQLALGIPDELRQQLWPSILFSRTHCWVKEFGKYDVSLFVYF